MWYALYGINTHRISKGVVPENGGFCCWLLTAVYYNNHRKGKTLQK